MIRMGSPQIGVLCPPGLVPQAQGEVTAEYLGGDRT